MSKAVDKKVVEMEFDNRRFEANVRTSISTLDKLKNSLNFDDVNKGLSGFQRSLATVDPSPIANAIDSIGHNLTKFDLVAVNVINRITNKALDAINRVNRALVIDPIKTGYNEYELKMNSVQTIMASTGESLSKVNGYLQELNEYSDRTIYSFSDMTQNIGKFTNAGVKLEDAVLAIKGISNEAAISGANANEASRAMYNFAQALSAGYVKLIDWKSIENANMATVEFKQTLIDTAVAMGTVVQVGDKYRTTTTDANGNVSELFTSTMGFNEALSAQWMTTDVLVKTLGMYADETSDLGKKAYAAAQDIKTFTQLSDTLKESAQSGWATTWELIVGDIDEAKKVLTQISEVVGGIIQKSADARNDIVRGTMASGYKRLTYELSKAGIQAGELDDALVKAAKNNNVAIDSFLETDKSVEASLKRGWLTNEMLAESLESLIATGEGLKELGYSDDQVKMIREMSSALREGKSELSDCVDAMDELSGRELIIESFQEVGKTLIPLFQAVGETFKEVFPPKTADDYKRVIERFHDLAESIKLTDDQLENFKTGTEGLLKGLKLVGDGVKRIARFGFDFITTCLRALNIDLFALYGNIGGLIGRFSDWIRSNESFSKSLDSIVQLGGSVVRFVRTLFGALLDVTGLSAVFSNMHVDTDKFFTTVSNVCESAATSLDSFSEAAKNVGHSIGEVLGKAVKKFTDGFSGIHVGTILTAGIGAMMIGLIKLVSKFNKTVKSPFESIKNLLDNVAEASSSIGDFVGNLGKSINRIAKAESFSKYAKGIAIMALSIGALAGALAALTLVDQGKLWSATGAVMAVGAMLAALSKIVGKVKMKPSSWVGMIGMSTSLLLVSIALGKLATVDWKGIIPALTMSITAIGIMVAMSAVLGKFDGKKSIRNALSIVGMATALYIVAKAMSKLSEVHLDSTLETIKVLAVAIVSLAGIGFVANKVKTKGMLSMVGLAIAFNLVLSAMERLSSVDYNAIGKALPQIAAIFALFSGVLLASRFAGKNASKAGTFMVKMAISIRIMASALSVLSAVDPAALVTATTVVSTLMTVMTGLAIAAGYAKKASLGSLITMSVAMGIVSLAISQLTKQDPNQVAMAGVCITSLIAAMVGLNALSSKIGKSNMTPMLLMATSVTILASAVSKLAIYDPTQIITAGAVLTAVLTAMIGLSALTKKVQATSMTPVIVMAISVSILASAVAKISDIPLGNLVKSGAAITVLLGVMIGMASLASAAKKVSIGPLVAISAAIGTIVVAISLLAMINPERVKAAGVALSMSIASIALLAAASSVVKNAVVPAVLLGGILTGVALILWGLSGLPIDKSIPIAESLSKLILSLSVSCALLGAVGAIGPVAFMGLGVLAGIIAEFGILIAAVSLFVDQNGKNVVVIKTAMDLIKDLGDTIGAFFGNIVGGFIGGITSGLETIGTNLTKFSEAIEPFMLFVSGIDSNSVNNAKTLAEVISTLVTAQMKLKSSGAFTDSKKFEDFGVSMSKFGLAYKVFAASLSDISADDVDKAAKVTESISQLSAAIPKSGGLFSMFDGAKDISAFGAQLEKYGNSIAAFSSSVSGETIDVPAINNAVAAGRALGSMAADLPNTGGVVSWFTGDNNLAEFANTLPAYGSALALFSKNCSGIIPANVDNARTATEPMLDIAKNLKNHGGLSSMIFGDNTMSAFGNDLLSYGGSLRMFSVKVAGISIDAMLGALTATQRLADIGAIIPAREAMKGKNFSTFGEQIVSYAYSLSGYADIVSGISYDSINVSVDAIQKFIDAYNRIVSIDPNVISNFRNALTELSNLSTSSFGAEAIAGATTTGENIAAAIATGFQKGTPAVVTAINQTVIRIVNSLSERQNEFTNAGRWIDTKLCEGMRDSAKTFEPTVATLVRAVVNVIGRNMPLMFNAGKLTANQYANGITVSAYLANIASNVMSQESATAARNAYSEFSDAGRYCVSGFAQGISSQTYEAQAAAAAMANAAYVSAKNRLRIHSPSKAFAQLGYYTDAGYASGVLNNIGIVSDSVQTLAGTAMDEFRRALSASKIAMNEMDALHPVIRPVVDLDDVRASAFQIDSMLTSTKARSIDTAISACHNTTELGSKTAGDTFSFTQINNSPKALSRLEIYRQTQNQINVMKGLVKR